MRWSLRRGNRDADGRVRNAPSAPASTAPAADPGWRALPPLTPAAPARSPLTAAPLVPRAPLTAEPARRAAAHPRDRAAGEPPAPGRVTGLASVRPPALAPIVPAVPPTPYVLDRPPLRHAPSRPLVEHPPLTEATDAFVGEPLAPRSTPAPPPPAPAFDPPRPPRTEPPVEAATEAGARFREALANLHRSGLPRYESPGEPPARAPEPPAPAPAAPPAVPPPAATPPAGAPPRLTHRRNTLAQSRRLGLGAPLRPEDESDADEEGDRGPATPADAIAPVGPPAPPRTADPVPPPTTQVASPEPPDPAPPAGPPPAAPPVPPTPALPVVPARALDSGPRPAATTPPLVFRARPGRPAPPAAARPVRKAVVTRPPAELAQALRTSHGVDVGDVPVHRDAAAGDEARDRRARAFSRGGRVFLPEAAGPLHSATARGLLAHELVHIAQQRRLGAALPEEDTPEGRALEAEAQEAERRYATEAFADAPLVHAPPPVSAGWVEERITQHALDMPMPAGYPQITNSISPGMLDEVKYTAQKIITDSLEDGSLSGVGGSAGAGTGRNPNIPLGIGIGNAQNLAEFQAQTLAALNAQRREAHQAEYASLADLSPEERRRIEARYTELYRENRDAILASQMQVAVQQLATEQHADLTWTPQGGFQRTGAPTGTTPGGTTPGGTTPGATATGTTTGTATTAPGGGAGRPSGPVPGTTASPSPATTPATTPTVPLPGAGPGALPMPSAERDEGYDVGVGHAHSEEEFREQVLVAMNMHRPPDRQLTWAQLSAGDQARVTARWRELAAAQEQQAEARRFQNALRAQASRRRAAPTATTPGTDAAPTAVVAGALAGAQTADARTAAEHTNDLETDSGVTNTTAAGHPAISVDRIDMDDLTVRIWERLRSRLRRELLVDRERAGLLTDFR